MDLGSGNSPAIKDLLQRGWRVIAVDSSRATLAILEKQFKGEINLGKLSLIEKDVATFTPLESADLVIAADIFPYINPSKFENLWNRIHDTFIKENGFLIGNFFRVTNATPEINALKEMGAWFLPDRRMVRPLLTNQGYEIIKCTFRKDQPNNDPICIQFIAKKTFGSK
ncbi:MAG: class I SAM-dependent methyltransferase [Parachlamydiaceae bacterium]|nr:class I SAM-dependent methyltransferase [Parachlamydiaceae bacterium]